MKAHGRGGTPFDWLLVAMIEHRLGRPGEAKHGLERAARAIALRAKEPAEDFGPPQTTWLCAWSWGCWAARRKP